MTSTSAEQPPAIGSEAPDFTTKDQYGETVTLSQYRGDKAVLLVFYPFAFSRICTGELCAVRDDIGTFQNDDVQVLGVSTDTMQALKAWGQQEGYAFPLLTDFWPHGAISKAYGTFFEPAGMAARGTFLVDRDGVLRYAEVHGPGEERDQSVWRAEIAKVVAG